MTRPEFILASGSSSRRTMLAAAGIDFTAIVPDIDEDAVRAKMPPKTAAEGRAVAEHLAERKALSVSARHPGRAGRWAAIRCWSAKAGCSTRRWTRRRRTPRLRALRGRTHELISAAVIAKGQELIWRCTDVARLADARFLGRVPGATICSAELPDILGSVGCYRIEGRGAQLFDARGRRPVHDPRPAADPAARGVARARSAAVMTAHGKLAAVIGWPVRQSVSPVLHSHWLKEHGIKGAYVALPIEPANFGRCVAALPLMGFAGASVTVPHKEAAFALASSLDEDATRDGRGQHARLRRRRASPGLNTDVRGFAASLAETLGADAARKGPAAVLGAGGAARAIVLALQRAGSPEIRIINRTPARSDALAAFAVGQRHPRDGMGRLEGGIGRCRAAGQHDEPRHDRKAGAGDRARVSPAVRRGRRHRLQSAGNRSAARGQGAAGIARWMASAC